jgi:hypothetical protein
MATTTTNYGFDVPTSSDLVKNGATAISTLGQDIDTFLFRPFGVNPVINSAMQIWQRGTSFTSSNVYTADRWYKGAAPAATFSRQVTNDTTNLPFIQYCTRIQRNSGSAATNAIDFGQNFESVNSIPFAGRSVTLSFYARSGANFSATSNTLTAQVYSGTGTDQSVFSGFTGQATVLSSAVTLTSTWQRFTATATVGATATQLALYFQYSPTGTAGANDYYEITGVQLEVGQASPFKTNQPTLATELAACQRYYWRSAGGTAYTVSGFGFCNNTTTAYIGINLPVSMRSVPASVEFSAQNLNDAAANYAVTAISMTSTWRATNMVMLETSVASGLTQYRPIFLTNNNNTAGYVGLSAEL